MRRGWKIVLGIVTVPVLAVSMMGAAGYARWDRTFDVAEPALRASADAEMIERGRYLAYGPAHCASCHTREDAWPALEAGGQPPLSGGFAFDLPFGRIHSANLTPDVETGIGGWTDGQLARVLRHGVRHDGRATIPFMEFQNLSDDDIIALMSFLRSQEPVHNEIPEHALNPVGKLVMAFMIKPRGPDGAPPVHTPEEAATLERGEYLANRVASCAGCHTKRNMMDGSYMGERFSGGHAMPLDSDPTKVVVTPNLTPDPETGHIVNWSEEQFIARFRAGNLVKGSHMPWVAFGRMSDTDLRAIHMYLRSLEPVSNHTGPIVQDAPSR